MAETPRRVLLAIDEGKAAAHAFDWYLKFIHQAGNDVILLHSLEAPDIEYHPFMGLKQQFIIEEFKRKEEEDKAVNAAYTAKMEENNISGRYIVKAGKAGPTIVQTAKEEKVDFIVIGTRGHGAIGRAFLGSVSHYVLHHAHCPCTIVHKNDA